MTTPTASDAFAMSTFPSMRARMGDWQYYATIMTFGEVARWVTRTDQIHSNARLREWIQRELQDQRIEQISNYIRQQPQHFFNALVVGIYDGEPEWFPLSVRDSAVLGAPQLAPAAQGALGLLRLKGDEKVFAIDGQHRVEGIRAAVHAETALENELQTVVFVAHSPTDSGRERTRRLFSTLNRQARPVSKGEIVALDEDDAFAVVTRQLVEKFEPLTRHRVAFGRTTPIAPNEVDAVTSILGLYDLVQAVSHEGKRSPKELRRFMAIRPADQVVKAMYDEQVEFWNALIEHVPEMKVALEASESAKACAPYRHNRGGHVLFRPAGQKAFAKAVRVLVERKSSVGSAVKRLSKVPMGLAKPPWTSVLWDTTSGVMITRSKNVGVASNVFLMSAGFAPADDEAKAKYQQLTGRSASTLRGPAKKKGKRSRPSGG